MQLQKGILDDLKGALGCMWHFDSTWTSTEVGAEPAQTRPPAREGGMSIRRIRPMITDTIIRRPPRCLVRPAGEKTPHCRLSAAAATTVKSSSALGESQC